MRRVIAAAVLVAAVAAAVPWALGLYLEHRHGLLLDNLVTRGYRIPVDEYRVGWLRSTMRTEIAPAEGEEQSRLRLNLRLRHGPEVWLGVWPPVVADADGRARVLGGPREMPPLVLAARLHGSGALDVALRVPDVGYSGAAGRLSLVSSDADLRLAREGTWALDGHIESLEATAPDGRRLRLDAIDCALAGADADAPVPLSRLRLAVGALHLDAAAARQPVDVEAFEASLTASATPPTTVAFTLGGSVAALSIGQDAYAPSALAATISGIDAAALRDLRVRLAALDGSGLSASQQGMLTVRLLLTALPRLLSATPAAALHRLSVTTPQGPIAATADLRMAPTGKVAEPGMSLAVPQAEGAALLSVLWGRLFGSAQIEAPRSLVVALLAEQQTRRVRHELALRGTPADTLPPALAADVEAAAQAATAALLREGWLKSEQGGLVAKLAIENGNLRVNGKAVALPDWLAAPVHP